MPLFGLGNVTPFAALKKLRELGILPLLGKTASDSDGTISREVQIAKFSIFFQKGGTVWKKIRLYKTEAQNAGCVRSNTAGRPSAQKEKDYEKMDYAWHHADRDAGGSGGVCPAGECGDVWGFDLYGVEWESDDYGL